MIAVVGFVESNAVSKKCAMKNGYEISANRELVAFGAANVIGVCPFPPGSFKSSPPIVLLWVVSGLWQFVSNCNR